MKINQVNTKYEYLHNVFYLIFISNHKGWTISNLKFQREKYGSPNNYVSGF